MVIALRFRPKKSPSLDSGRCQSETKLSYAFSKLAVYIVKSTKTSEIVNSLNLNVILNLNTKKSFLVINVISF